MLPRGLLLPVAGGLLIGLGIGAIYFSKGRIAGISSFLTAVQSRWSRRAYFNTAAWLEDLRWKSVLVAGLLAGAALVTLLQGGIYLSSVSVWRLAVGGLLVGFGTRLGSGCTSGHGICGISAGAPPSIVGTITFVAVGMIVAGVLS